MTIANTGGSPQDMTGWTLTSETGGQEFRFPDDYVLDGGATVRITSGRDGYYDPPEVLQWLKADGTPSRGYIWNNDGDPAILTDASGNMIDRFP